MALFGKERDRNDRPRPAGPDPVTAAPDSAPREVEMFERERDKSQPDETSATSAFLGKGSRVTGKLTFEGTVRIEGHVEGEISAQDTLIIGETAVVSAQIHGTSVVVHGRVTGDISARKRLEIKAPGKVFGNISTPSLVIHEGVIFEGQCAMGGPETGKIEKDRKVAFFPKDERPGPKDERADVAAGHKAHSEAK
jgi:cytoskeletal protein CcmA (bactofilin family)